MGKKPPGRPGFSLIELLSVISVISVLATVVIIGNLNEQPKKGRDAKRKSDLSQIRRAFEDYSTDKKEGCYPSSPLPACGQRLEEGGKVYLPSVLCDPKTNSPYGYSPIPAGSCPTSYWLYATLEKQDDPDIEKVGCSGGCPGASGYNFRLGSPNAQ